jgi:hypothetical protein
MSASRRDGVAPQPRVHQSVIFGPRNPHCSAPVTRSVRGALEAWTADPPTRCLEDRRIAVGVDRVAAVVNGGIRFVLAADLQNPPPGMTLSGLHGASCYVPF